MRSLRCTRLVGTGAFGSVYLAELEEDSGARRPVAVKLLHEGHPNADMFMSRVRDEARLLGLLRDENILEVLGLVTLADRDAVLMEYVDGADLGALIEEGQAPPPRALAELGAAVAGALGRAHRATHPTTGVPLGVVHRDVKPANVMLTARGAVKLLDFGVASARFEARESRTGQHVLGTLNYMAPEYILTGQVTPAADTYGLALTLWEAMTAEVYGQPRLAENQHRARLNERMDRIADTHPGFVPLLRRMLAWDPTARPAATDIEAELRELAGTLPGLGLRAWAAAPVPAVRVARQPKTAADDPLIGRVLPLEDPLYERSSPAHPRPPPAPDDTGAVPAGPRKPSLAPPSLVDAIEAVDPGGSASGSPPRRDAPTRILSVAERPGPRRPAPATLPAAPPPYAPRLDPRSNLARTMALDEESVPPPTAPTRPPPATRPPLPSPVAAVPTPIAPSPPPPRAPAPPVYSPSTPRADLARTIHLEDPSAGPPPSPRATKADPGLSSGPPPAPPPPVAPPRAPARARPPAAGPPLSTVLGGAVVGIGLGMVVVVLMLVALYLHR